MVAKLRIGVVGAGFVSFHHLAAWRAIDSANFVAIADVDRRKAFARAREFGIDAVYDSAEAMLDTDRLDAIDIATPVETHAHCCRLAADRGVAILCQKPLAPTLDEARALVRDVDGRVRLMVNENWRFRPHYRCVRQWIDEAGDVQQLRLASRSSGLVSDASGTMPALARQPFLANLDRLIIGELLIHHLDVARWLVGPLHVRDALTVRGSLKGEHAATILLASDRGCAVVVEGNLAAAGFPATPVDELDVVSARASIRLEGDRLELAAAHAETLQLDLARDYQSAFTHAARHFATCIATGKPFESDAEDNLRTLALVDAAYRCAEARR